MTTFYDPRGLPRDADGPSRPASASATLARARPGIGGTARASRPMRRPSGRRATTRRSGRRSRRSPRREAGAQTRRSGCGSDASRADRDHAPRGGGRLAGRGTRRLDPNTLRRRLQAVGAPSYEARCGSASSPNSGRRGFATSPASTCRTSPTGCSPRASTRRPSGTPSCPCARSSAAPRPRRRHRESDHRPRAPGRARAPGPGRRPEEARELIAALAAGTGRSGRPPSTPACGAAS